MRSESASYYLGEKYFVMTLVGALALHIGIIAIWQSLPRQAIVDIPVRVLNIKLGDDGEEISETVVATADTHAPAVNPDAVNRALDQAFVDPRSIIDAPTAPKQFVRTPSPKVKQDDVGGPKASSPEMNKKYGIIISEWIMKFQKYPEEARSAGVKGQTVVRLRVDRRGNVRYKGLEYSTGSEILDKAAIDMVSRANPVPAVPDNMATDELIEFLIPVSFK